MVDKNDKTRHCHTLHLPPNQKLQRKKIRIQIRKVEYSDVPLLKVLKLNEKRAEAHFSGDF